MEYIVVIGLAKCWARVSGRGVGLSSVADKGDNEVVKPSKGSIKATTIYRKPFGQPRSIADIGRSSRLVSKAVAKADLIR